MHKPANTAIYETLSEAKMTCKAEADATINCDGGGEATPYTYTVVPRGGPPLDAGQSTYRYTAESAHRFLQGLYNEITPLLKQTFDVSILPAIQMQIEGIGNQLYSELIPAPLQEYMRGLKQGATINISAKDMWIPWEILHDGTEFWGVRYNLRRLPRLPLNTSAKGRRQSTEHCLVSGPVERVVNVVGNDLTATEALSANTTFDKLSKTYRLQVNPLGSQPVAIHELKPLLKDVDVLHITCHGILDQTGHYLQLGPGQQHRLTVTTVRLLPVSGGLVFANACSSAAPSSVLGDFVNFGWAFYEAGAEVFIGTLVPVPVRYALDFAHKFYAIWKPGKMGCGTALYRVKRQMATSGNLFWLFYCQYGTP